MFEAGYDYSQVTINKSHPDAQVIQEIIFRFKTESNVHYIVRVHEYPHKVYALKFHLRAHKDLSTRYNLVLNHRFTSVNPSRVIRTVINIMLDILTKDELASFAFVGVYKLKHEQIKMNRNSKENQDTELTQRFRTYKRITEYFLGTQTFKHTFEAKSNAYLVVNKRHANYERMNEEIILMFKNLFRDLGELR